MTTSNVILCEINNLYLNEHLQSKYHRAMNQPDKQTLPCGSKLKLKEVSLLTPCFLHKAVCSVNQDLCTGFSFCTN